MKLLAVTRYVALGSSVTPLSLIDAGSTLLPFGAVFDQL